MGISTVHTENKRYRSTVVGALLLLLLVVWASLAGSAHAQTHFTSCASGTGDSVPVAIPKAAIFQHDLGYFTLAANDEIAVFRPDGSLCTGVAIYPDDNVALSVWGDNAQTAEEDGMMAGEVMLWKVWDSSENKEWNVNVSYVSTPPYHGNGQYGSGRLYQLSTFTPTAVTLAGLSVTPDGPGTGWLLIVALLALVSLLFFRTQRKNAAAA